MKKKFSYLNDHGSQSKMIYFVVILISLFVYKSGYCQVIVTRSFPIEKDIEGKPVNLNLRCDDICMVGDNVLVIQSDGNPRFHLYESENFKLVREFGLHGKGPNEFIGNTEFYNQVTIENGNILFWAFDRQARKFQQISIDENLGRRGVSVGKQILMSSDFRAEFGIFFISDSLVVGTSSAENESFLWKEKGPFTKMQHFFRYNPTSKEIAWRKPFPLMEFSGKSDCGNIYQDWPILKPDGTRIASSFTHFDQIIIYNIEGLDLIRIISPIKPPRLVLPDQSRWFEKNRFYYIHGYATNNYIYTVYRNDTYENLVNLENKA